MIYQEYYEQHLEMSVPGSDGEAMAPCPFHDDTNPSLCVNVQTGLWLCQGCGKKGDVYSFEQGINDCSFTEAKDVVDRFLDEHDDDCPAPISEEVVKEWHKTLVKSARKNLTFLIEKCGWTEEIIAYLAIGWDGERYTIPIRNAAGVIVNVRRYQPGVKNKMVSFDKGYGTARIWGHDVLEKSKKIILTEGEKDRICLLSRGIPAVTTTSGAEYWNPRWNYLFRGKEVFIVPDIDEPGKAGAKKKAEFLSKVATVHIVDLPITEPANGDLTNYFVDYGHTKEEFTDLLKVSQVFHSASSRLPDYDAAAPDDEVIEIDLNKARHADYRGNRVSFTARVAGLANAPYDLPREVTFTCTDVGSRKECSWCALSVKAKATNSGNQVTWRLGARLALENPLDLTNVTEDKQVGQIKKWCGVVTKCPIPTHEVGAYINLEEAQLIPEDQFSIATVSKGEDGKAKRLGDEDPVHDVHQTAYFLGFGLKHNTPYQMTSLRTVIPGTQKATFLITDATMEGSEITNYTQTAEMNEKLKVFQPAPGQTPFAKLQEIAADLTHNVTQIYGREHVVIGMDLVYHSALSFYFQNRYEHRGWIEGLFMGDPRSGKSQIMRALLGHYRLGELVSAENTSFAGLIGGLQQRDQKNWFVSWGKWVLNDMKLMAMDEVSSLSFRSIEDMSNVRTDGVASISKIVAEKARARTRVIWSGNARGKVGNESKPLKAYPYGVTAIMELMGKPEDVARFTFAVGLASDDVPEDEPNKLQSERPHVPHTFTSDLCHALLLWVWSRQAEQVIFTQDAEKACLEYAVQMGHDYSSGIPLVQTSDHRLKMARIAAAIAGRLFSTDLTGENIIVTRAHVDAAYQYLEQEYTREFWHYKGWSAATRLRENNGLRSVDEATAMLLAEPKLCHVLLQYDEVTPQDVATQMGHDMAVARGYFGSLCNWGMLQMTGQRGGYSKTPLLVKILRQIYDQKQQENMAIFEEEKSA